MKTHCKLIALAIIMIPGFLFFVSCNNDDSGSGSTRVELRLTDAPAPYDEVNIEIQSVEIHASNNEADGWQTLTLLKPGIYNLLDFQNGVDTLLAAETIPSGKISQIRLILGNNNTIVKDGVSYALKTPSGQTSGLKLNLHDELIDGITYRLWIDFDASRSIVETGSGKYLLKPVIRTYTDAMGGTLQGTVLPTEAQASVWAILGTDSLLAYPDARGFYRISGLAPSTSWKVFFDANDATGYKDSLRTEVSITKETVTTINVMLKQ